MFKHLRCHPGRGEELVLEGIDTPETKKPGYTVRYWRQEDAHFAESALVGQRVAVITDPTQGLHDRYGRTLAYLVKADGWDYSLEAARVARAGMARSYIYPSCTRGRLPTAWTAGR